MPKRIGEKLIKIGAITKEQRDEILRMQNNGDSRLFGVIAVDKKYVNFDILDQHLEGMKILN